MYLMAYDPEDLARAYEAMRRRDADRIARERALADAAAARTAAQRATRERNAAERKARADAAALAVEESQRERARKYLDQQAKAAARKRYEDTRAGRPLRNVKRIEQSGCHKLAASYRRWYRILATIRAQESETGSAARLFEESNG